MHLFRAHVSLDAHHRTRCAHAYRRALLVTALRTPPEDTHTTSRRLNAGVFAPASAIPAAVRRSTGRRREMGAPRVEGMRTAIPTKVSTRFERGIRETYRNLPGRRPPKRRANAIQPRTSRHKPSVIENERAGASAQWAPMLP